MQEVPLAKNQEYINTASVFHKGDHARDAWFKYLLSIEEIMKKRFQKADIVINMFMFIILPMNMENKINQA